MIDWTNPKAEKILREAAIINGKPLPEDWKLKPIKDMEGKKRVTLLDLFK